MSNYEKYILYGLLVVVAAGLIFALVGFPSGAVTKENTNQKIVSSDNNIKSENNKEISSSANDLKSIDSGSTESGDVSVELTPSFLGDKLIVSSSINTHSVDLTQFNLKEITTLEYNGKTIKPASAPDLMGHHSGGDIVFDVGKEIKEFIIKIKGIPKVEERVFTWQ